MADYNEQTAADFAKALRDRRDAEQRVEVTGGRYDASKNNNAGAGRGKQGGPTAEEIQNKQASFKKGGRISASNRAAPKKIRGSKSCW